MRDLRAEVQPVLADPRVAIAGPRARVAEILGAIVPRARAKSWAGDSNNFGESVRYVARSGALREG